MNLVWTSRASAKRAIPPSARALAVNHPVTEAATARDESAAVAHVVRRAASTQSGARKIARSARKPMATPQATDAATSLRPRSLGVAAPSARQKRSAQSVESAASSVYG